MRRASGASTTRKLRPGRNWMLVIDVNGDGMNDVIYGHGHLRALLARTGRRGRHRGCADVHGTRDRGPSRPVHTLVLADVNQTVSSTSSPQRLRATRGTTTELDPLGVSGSTSRRERLSPPTTTLRTTPARRSATRLELRDRHRRTSSSPTSTRTAGTSSWRKSGLYLFENGPRPRADGQVSLFAPWRWPRPPVLFLFSARLGSRVRDPDRRARCVGSGKISAGSSATARRLPGLGHHVGRGKGVRTRDGVVRRFSREVRRAPPAL